MTVSISTEFLEDKVRFTVSEARIARYEPDGKSENVKILEFSYETIDHLGGVPSDFQSKPGKWGHRGVSLQTVYIPRCNKTVGFICESVPENASGEREGSLIGGPYLIEN